MQLVIRVLIQFSFHHHKNYQAVLPFQGLEANDKHHKSNNQVGT